MSPEQALGGPVDGRADVFALAATLYHLFTGALPGVKPHRTCDDAHRCNSCVPRRLSRVLGKALEYDRDARYASARELAHDLTRVRLGMPVRARGPNWIRRLRMWWQDRS